MPFNQEDEIILWPAASIAAICHGLQLLAGLKRSQKGGVTATLRCSPEFGEGEVRRISPSIRRVENDAIHRPGTAGHPAWLAALLKVLGAKITI